jgi:glycosyltransferase involved in cell wall biosynthesis
MAAFYVAALGLYKECTFVNTSHGTYIDKRKLTAFAYRKARMIACGDMVKKNLVEFFGLPDNQVTVVHNAVKSFDGNILENQVIKALHEKGYYVVGNVGRLSEEKGMKYYIRAIPMVLARYPKTHFLMIGDGEEIEELKTLVKELNVADAVTFMGYRPDVQNIVSQIDLVVLSSLCEGLPLVPMEAFSVGKTIVATAVGGTVEIVEDGKSGFLVEAQNSQLIAEKINWLIEHPDEQKKMEIAAKERFEQEFSFEKLVRGYISYYEQVLCLESTTDASLK